MKRQPRNVAASVRQKLLNLAHERGDEFELVLTQFAIERLIARLAASARAKDFVLKGAVLFTLWTGQPHRPTRDLDLLGRKKVAPARLTEVFRDVCATIVPDDGLVFDRETIRASPIREAQEYGGLRVELVAGLGTARVPLQVDVGFGDAIVPSPAVIAFPSLLAFPTSSMSAYPREAVIAEKFHAMVMLGMANSRMKDYYDAWTLARLFDFDGATLGRAIAATFRRRRTEISPQDPMALTDEFSLDRTKQVQWQAFVRRGRLVAKPPTLREVVDVVRGFLLPVLTALRAQANFPLAWPAGGPWREGAESAGANP